jgi:hypothetical protein
MLRVNYLGTSDPSSDPRYRNSEPTGSSDPRAKSQTPESESAEPAEDAIARVAVSLTRKERARTLLS